MKQGFINTTADTKKFYESLKLSHPGHRKITLRDAISKSDLFLVRYSSSMSLTNIASSPKLHLEKGLFAHLTESS